MTITNVLLLAVLTGILHAQGPLTPPGPPEATMKTLDQIEPRTPISSLPYSITESGSYYFTGNLEFSDPGGDAITITASNVTLDLMGFTLSSTPEVTGKGISIPSIATRGITVRNGNIAGNTTVTLSGSPTVWTTDAAGFYCGIHDNSSNAGFYDLSINGARNSGLSSLRFATVDNVRAEQNGNVGIYVYFGNIAHSTASCNGGWGIFASAGNSINCNSYYNGGYGIYAANSSVTNFTAIYNGSYGIYTNGSSVTNSTAVLNTTYDIYAPSSAVSFCHFGTFFLTGSTLTGNFPSP